jgi:hypothetical protein
MEIWAKERQRINRWSDALSIKAAAFTAAGALVVKERLFGLLLENDRDRLLVGWGERGRGR